MSPRQYTSVMFCALMSARTASKPSRLLWISLINARFTPRFASTSVMRLDGTEAGAGSDGRRASNSILLPGRRQRRKLVKSLSLRRRAKGVKVGRGTELLGERKAQLVPGHQVAKKRRPPGDSTVRRRSSFATR